MRKCSYRRGIRIKYITALKFKRILGKGGRLHLVWRILTGKRIVVGSEISPQDIILFERI